MASMRAKEGRNPFAGMPPDMQSAMQKVLSTFNTENYDGDMSSLMHHLSMQDPTDLEALFSAVSGAKSSAGTEEKIAEFDFAKAPVRKNSFWVMQLMGMGFQDKVGGDYRDEYFSGSTPVFSIIIYDDREQFLVQEMAPPGMPSSNFLLKTLKQAIASPLPPNRPCLPNVLIIAHKLSPHIDSLRPFLDSLPAPFSWRLETPGEAENVASGVHELNLKGIAKATQRADEEKQLGNAAVGRKDRPAAVKHYSEAFEFLRDALAQNPTSAEKRDLQKRAAVILSNRAAAWLLDGAGQDAQKALQDAELAITFDEEYGKAYYRQAKAHQLLGSREKAIDVLASALKRPTLASDKGLNDTLIDAYGGFPDSADELRTLFHRLFVDENGDLRARNIKEFRRRADVHAQKVLGPNFTAASV